jgi:hypothetical protein
MVDLVNPEHYRTGDIECIAAIEAAMSPEEFAGYLRGNIIKYIWRYEKKHRNNYRLALRDLEKAQWYLHRLTSFRMRHWEIEQ